MGVTKSSVASPPATTAYQRSTAYTSTVVVAYVPKPKCTRRVLSALGQANNVGARLPTTIVSQLYSYLDHLDHCAAARVCRHFFRCSALPTSSPHELFLPLLVPFGGRDRVGVRQCECSGASASFPGVTIHWRPVRIQFRATLSSAVVARWLADNERLRHLVLVLDATKVAFRHSWTLPATLTDLTLSDAFDEDEVARVLESCRHALRRLSLCRITFATPDSLVAQLHRCARLTDVTLSTIQALASLPLPLPPPVASAQPHLKLANLVVTGTSATIVAALVVECTDTLRTLRCVDVQWTPRGFQASVARCHALHTLEFVDGTSRPPIPTPVFAELPRSLAVLRTNALYDVRPTVLARLPHLTELHCATIGDTPCPHDQKRAFVHVRRLRLVSVPYAADNYAACGAYLVAVLPCIRHVVVPRSLDALAFVVALCRICTSVRTIAFCGREKTAAAPSDRIIQLSLDRFPHLSCETYADTLV